MRDDKFSAMASEAEAADAALRAARPDKFEHNGGRHGATRRTVGVYDRPARRARLSLPLLVILILATLVSVVASARFLF